MKLNYTKSEAAWIGSQKHNNFKPISCKWVDLNNGALKILGIYFSYSKSEVNRLNFRASEEKFDVLLNRWLNRNLTIYGKIEIIKTLGISKLLYVCNMAVPSTEFINNIQNKINSFVWKINMQKLNLQQQLVVIIQEVYSYQTLTLL